MLKVKYIIIGLTLQYKQYEEIVLTRYPKKDDQIIKNTTNWIKVNCQERRNELKKNIFLPSLECNFQLKSYQQTVFD